MLISSDLREWTKDINGVHEIAYADSGESTHPFFYNSKQAWFNSELRATSTSWGGKKEDEDKSIEAKIALGAVIHCKDHKIGYWVFHNDDKYMHLNNKGVAYQDTNLYDFFLGKLVLKESDCLRKDIRREGSYIDIFGRSQYGHFLLDDLLPALTYISHQKEHPMIIYLFYSKNWQLITSQYFASRMGIRSQIVPVKYPNYSCTLNIIESRFILPCYPGCLMATKKVLDRSHKFNQPEAGGHYYLSREGFDRKPRVALKPNLANEVPSSNILVPHNISAEQLYQRISDAQIVYAEPGTTALIPLLSGNTRAQYRLMLSIRSLKECNTRYFYSGWRYLVPWLAQIMPIWGRPIAKMENPFSDICEF